MPKYPTLSQNERANVVVVGGGIAGLSCAYMLARGGKSVILLEDGELASGETGRTTAHLNTYIDDGFSDIISSHGKEAACIVREAFGEAVDAIERIVKEENIDCDFERVDGYLFGKESRIYEELEGCRAVGFPAQLVDGAPVTGERTGKALLLPRQALFHPLKYLSRLAECITTKYGGRIFTGTHVAKFEGGSTAHVTTSQNLVVSADHIIVATNVPVNDKVEFYLKMTPYRTYAIGAPVPKGSIPRATFYDTDDPYHYVRLVASENPNEEILVTGGEDHMTGHSHNFEEKYQTLYNWTKRFFPQIGPLQFKWSGQVIEPLDGLGYIGVNPMDKANVYVATGDSGNGMINGTIAGILLSSLIQVQRHHWSLVFDPSRKPGIHEAKEFLEHNAKVAVSYKDWVTGSDVADIEEIRPGCGAVMRHGLSKSAVFKDLQGKVHSFSAICPHLGAIVNWNDSEKSWDCPAHGSRFDPYGCVVNGPANQNLTPKPQSST